MESVLTALLKAQAAGTTAVLATVVRARGSVPRHAGTKMLVYADGRTIGTVGGGEMEARVVEEALAAGRDGQPRMMTYALVDPQRGDPGVCGGEMEIFVEPYLPPATVLVVGCGHVGKAVAELAHWLGYRVAVTDDREALASTENIPDADVHLPGAIDQALAQFTIHENCHIVVVTRNVGVDRRVLPLLLPSPAAYIGVMGSQRRWAHTRQLLLEDGLDPALVDRCHSPLGLALNAESPAEIAVSIMAEITMLRRGGDGGRMAAPATQEA
jgi:xanthine dehydrogenase accessory factor